MSEQTYQHRNQLDEQNNLLDELHNSVMNTRHYAVNIGNELNDQDGMLDHLHHGVSRTANESSRQNQNVIQLLRESENRGFWSCVILLVVVIIILLWI